MKKIIPNTCVLISLSLAILVYPYALAKEGGKSAEIRLTAEYLAAAKWGPEHQKGKYIKFSVDGIFECTEDFLMDSKLTKGTYALKNGLITLIKEGDGGPFLKNGRLAAVRNGLHFTRQIVFNDGEKIWDKGSTVSEGAPVTVETVPCVTMGVRNASVTVNAKFRVKPDMKAKELAFARFKTGDTGLEEEKIAYIPEGTKIEVLARTAKKFKVQKWNNYWYYVDIQGPWDVWQQGWVFAELVKLD